MVWWWFQEVVYDHCWHLKSHNKQGQYVRATITTNTKYVSVWTECKWCEASESWWTTVKVVFSTTVDWEYPLFSTVERGEKDIHFSSKTFLTCCFLHGHPEHFDLRPGSLATAPATTTTPTFLNPLTPPFYWQSYIVHRNPAPSCFPLPLHKSRLAQFIKSATVGLYFQIQAS